GQRVQAVSNFAAGVGVKYGGFKFDYGYHSFVTLPGVSNHFFSLSYGVSPPVEKEAKEKLVLDEPQDKLITFEGEVKVVGNVLDPSARSLKVKGEPIKFGLKGEFESGVSLEVGKNKIEVSIFDNQGKLLESKRVRVLRLMTFPDVVQDYWVAQPISLLAMQKIITGYPDGTFKPEGNITRAEMCTLLMKTKEPQSQKTEEPKFKDVSAKHWAAAYIARASEIGVVKGYPDGSFRPNGKITRAEGLAMIARFAGISEEVYVNEFPDVAASHWAAKIIAGSYKEGLLEYLKGKNFAPNKLLTRAETVEMLHRTSIVKEILAKDLLNWDSY
ncbi:MAG: S-layer homology domain-containing protein, partial [Candidatus Margulisiibacteriota bacterium]